jgi:hypothetical protein
MARSEAWRKPAELSLVAEHQRGHGALYGAVNHGRIDSGGPWLGFRYRGRRMGG